MSSISDLLCGYTTALLCNSFRKRAEHIFKTNTGPTVLTDAYILTANSYVQRLNDTASMSQHITQFLTYCARVDRAIRQEQFMKNIVREFCPPGIDQYTGANRDTLLGRKVLFLAMNNSVSRLIKSESILDSVVNNTEVATDVCGKLVSDVIKNIRQELITESVSKKATGAGVPEPVYNALKSKYDKLVAEIDNHNNYVADMTSKMKDLINAAEELERENKSLRLRLREREEYNRALPTVVKSDRSSKSSRNVDEDNNKYTSGSTVSKNSGSHHSSSPVADEDYFETNNNTITEQPTPVIEEVTSTTSSSRSKNRSKFQKYAQEITPDDSVSSVQEKPHTSYKDIINEQDDEDDGWDE